MSRTVGRLAIQVILILLPVFASGKDNSLSIFGSGIRRSSQPDSSRYGKAQVASWQGFLGLAFQRRLSAAFEIEVAVERGRHVVPITAGGRICGLYHNTCFDTHRMAVLSTPITALGRYTYSSSRRLVPFASVGVRYVPAPAVQDITPERSVPRWYFTYAVKQRLTPEVGGGAMLRMGKCGWLVGEVRVSVHRGVPWDPRRRGLIGFRL